MNTNQFPFLTVQKGSIDGNLSDFEIVERKGIGHPDSLADGIADAISIAFSRICLERFGVVLHHNVDKAFIGRGHFLCDFGSTTMLSPIEVVVNGRMSNTMDGSSIDIESIQKEAAVAYVGNILPYLDADTQLTVNTNASQRTQRDRWFSPRSIDDIPDATRRTANDTSVCIGHYPFTLCERLALELEKSLWHLGAEARLVPRLLYTGQDVKVMVIRRGQEIDVTACVPIIARFCDSEAAYVQYVRECEEYLREVANNIVQTSPEKTDGFTVSLNVNSGAHGYRRYMLGIGSCIECGEEGVVGRGNTIRGFISCTRPHSVEAPYGKNPVYHTGRVHGFLSQQLAKSIFEHLGIKCSVFILTKTSHALLPPSHVYVKTEVSVDQKDVEEIVGRVYSLDYLSELLTEPLTLRTW